MKYLLDTNILLRLVELTHPQHKEAAEALKTLRRNGFAFPHSSAKHLGILECLHTPAR